MCLLGFSVMYEDGTFFTVVILDLIQNPVKNKSSSSVA